MDACFGLLILGFAAFGVYHTVKRVIRGNVQPAPAPPIIHRPATRVVSQHRQRDAQSRAFQTALLQLDGAPDFRRAATVAAAAKLVPVEFKRRQFTRFQPSLAAHYRRCQAARGADEEVLLQSLRELVVALGIAEFEADYIRDAVGRQTSRNRPSPSPTNRIAELKREHELRVGTIREQLAQTPELQEQLLEAEENRFRQALENAFETTPSARASESPL